jgi:hypothetical protein
MQRNLSSLLKAFSSSANLKERLSKETLLEDLPMSQRSVKLPFLQLSFSSSSELEESSLEKSKLLKAAHAQDMIF